MTIKRQYALLCPVARALDRVGDRWSLLILRDLHAGPARFSDLLSGLTGIATNVLTERLQDLGRAGLVERRDADFGLALYQLTELGRRSERLLYELAVFGTYFEAAPETRRPGNLRTIVVPMRSALKQSVDPFTALSAELRVDGEPFAIEIADGEVAMQARPSENPDVILTTSYEALIAVAEGHVPLETFVERDAVIEELVPRRAATLMTLMQRALNTLQNRDG